MIGTVNTVILLTSSFVVAWAVHLAERGRGRGVAVLLGVAALFGIAFLGLKGLEYYQEWDEGLVPGLRFEEQGPHAKAMELFYFLYFMLTGVHGLHVTIGVGLLGIMAVRAWRGAFSSAYYTPVEVSGLYWHFVDIVWIFLYPLIYLSAGAADEGLPAAALTRPGLGRIAGAPGGHAGPGYVPMGSFNVVAALAISVLKTLLVVIVFMKLLDSGHLVRFTAVAGLFWLALLFALGVTDYLTRTTAPTGSYTRGPVAEGGS